MKLKHDALQPPLAARRWGTGRTVLTAHAGSCCGGVEHPSSSALSSTLPHSQKFCRRSLNLISFSTTHKTFYQMSADSAASISHKHFSEQNPPKKHFFSPPVLLHAHQSSTDTRGKKQFKTEVVSFFPPPFLALNMAHSFIRHILLVCVARINIYTCEHIHKARLKKNNYSFSLRHS